MGNINWQTLYENFHFIRPDWLFGLVVVALVWLLWFVLEQKKTQFKQPIFSKNSLNHLRISGNKTHHRFYPFWVFIVLFLGVLISAGPTWQKQNLPVFKNKAATLIVLDASYSMKAIEQGQSRLDLAKRKILDILNNYDDEIGLVVYSGSAHLLSPLTFDHKNIKQVLEMVNVESMPSYGNATVQALLLANTHLKNTRPKQHQTRILLLTDDIHEQSIQTIQNITLNSSLRILVIGSEQPNLLTLGKEDPKIPPQFRGTRQDVSVSFKTIERFADTANAVWARYTLDDQDIQTILPKNTYTPTGVLSNNQTTLQWVDEGRWLIFILLPLLALVLKWRRQYALLLALFVVLWLTIPTSQAFVPLPFLENADQTAQRYFNDKEYDKAAETFQSVEHQAISHYKNKKYSQAAHLYQPLQTADGFYNLGNTQALQGFVDTAITSYQQALLLNPKHESAIFNKALLEQYQQQSSSQPQPNEDGQKDSQQEEGGNPPNEPKDDFDDSKGKENNDQKEGSGQESGSEDPQRSDKDKGDEPNKDGQKDSQQEEGGNPPNEPKDDFDDSKGKENNDQKEGSGQESGSEDPQRSDKDKGDEPAKIARIIDTDDNENFSLKDIRRVVDDPSGYIRRRFEQEYQENPTVKEFSW